MAYSPKSLLERFWEKVNISDDPAACWEWTAVTAKGGYGKFWDGERKVSAHRFAYAIYHGSIPDGLFVLHRCDNPCCVRKEHLFIGTQKDNIHDCIAKDRNIYGSDHANSVLNEEKVLALREEFSGGKITSPELAKKHGVEPSTVMRILRGEGWQHVAGPTAPNNRKRGEQRSDVKLTELQVSEIRGLYGGGGVSQRALAKKFGISSSLVGDIIHYKRWRHVEGPPTPEARKGERSPTAKLTEPQVLEIRKMYAAGGTTYSKLAQKFGVGLSTIGSIINYRKWKHVT